MVETVKQQMRHCLYMRGEGCVPCQRHPERQHVNTVSDEVGLVVQRLTRRRYADHDVCAAGKPAQHGLERGEQYRKEGRTVGRPCFFQRSVEFGIEPGRVGCTGIRPQRRADPVCRKFGQHRKLGEERGPITEIGRLGVLRSRLGNRVLRESRRCRLCGRLALVRHPVVRREITQDDVHGPAVADDVVRGEHENVAIRCEPHEGGSYQRACPKVEWHARIGGNKGGERCIGIMLAREILELHLKGKRGCKVHALVVAPDVPAQCLVAGDDGVQRGHQSRGVDLAIENNADGLIEGAGCLIAHLRGGQDLQLRLGERGRFDPGGRLYCRRGDRPCGFHDARRLQGVERSAEGLFDCRDVGIGVRGGEKAGIAFLDMHAEQTHLRPEKRCQGAVCGEIQVEPA